MMGSVNSGSDEEKRTELALPQVLSELPSDLKLVVVSGPDRGLTLPLRPGRYVVGQADGCALTLHDPQVSRQHLEVVVDDSEVMLRDLGSSNGSFFDGARFQALAIGIGAQVQIGGTELRVVSELAALPPSTVDQFGELLGRTAIMRQLFTILERVAASDTAILLHGETGVGKELAAEAIHEHSTRASGPFVICDLAGVPPSLIESELFGHVRGAFTGADRDREGAFVQADGGTIFLDEIGELGPEVQPRLLRALERRQVKPVGGAAYRNINVRVIAATNRDLQTEVKEGRFRRDLYHRLAVVRIEIPPLRQRRDDIALLVDHFVAQAAQATRRPAAPVPPATMAMLARHDWPGNVRELRNVLEQALALSPGPAIDTALLSVPEPLPGARDGGHGPATAALPFRESREKLIEAWEREYLVDLLGKAGHNVSEAARRAGLSRVYLHELIRKHGLQR
jgi:DNA-binding NtrC family response regulator